jgi:signal peptidase I
MVLEAEISNLRRKFGRRILSCSALFVVPLALLPAYVQAYTLSGTSVAPTLLLGDWVWVNRAAYDVRLPYSDQILWNRAGPTHGDLVLVASPDAGYPIFKRVVAIPGDRVAMHQHHLILNGRTLVYAAIDSTEVASVPADNELGSTIEMETLGTRAHLITYTPDSDTSSFPEVLVPADHYFLMGDNRDRSRDSRFWGSVPRQRLRGKVFRQPRGG